MTTFEERLRKYARLAVRAGINVQPGQELIIGADVTEASFMRLVAEEAYDAGAINVHIAYGDEAGTLVRYAHGSSEAMSYAPAWLAEAYAERVRAGAGYMRLLSGDPALLKDVPADKIAVSSKAQGIATQGLSKAIMAGGSWSAIGYAAPAWAKVVFPHDSEEVAVEKLWDAIFLCCHIDEEDPVASWLRHQEVLEAKQQALTERSYAALQFTGAGTDIKIGLADNHLWSGGRFQTSSGAKCSPNIPTEEVFTMPHRERVEGVVRSSKPLSVRGSLIDEIEMTFEGGKVVKATASQGEEVLKGLLDTDEGARHLGEVALVPNSSRVGRAKVLFFNTLFDENAACHIALGRALSVNMRDYDVLTDDQQEANGFNSSLIHVDWMIGSDQIDVDGIKQDGSSEPLMRGCEWVD